MIALGGGRRGSWVKLHLAFYKLQVGQRVKQSVYITSEVTQIGRLRSGAMYRSIIPPRQENPQTFILTTPKQVKSFLLYNIKHIIQAHSDNHVGSNIRDAYWSPSSDPIVDNRTGLFGVGDATPLSGGEGKGYSPGVLTCILARLG